MSFGSTLWIVFLTGTVATTLGAAPVLALRSLSPRLANHFIALAAGVMLAASVYALLPAALVAAAKQHPGNWATPLTLAALGEDILDGPARCRNDRLVGIDER